MPRGAFFAEIPSEIAFPASIRSIFGQISCVARNVSDLMACRDGPHIILFHYRLKWNARDTTTGGRFDGFRVQILLGAGFRGWARFAHVRLVHLFNLGSFSSKHIIRVEAVPMVQALKPATDHES